ncbi:MAG: hypothetical protein U5N53_17825 [Mycobacterium sp.]|nr:hypothetical protein [Mycobacterium sp.]
MHRLQRLHWQMLGGMQVFLKRAVLAPRHTRAARDSAALPTCGGRP